MEINGLFEIHIIVSECDQSKLFAFVLNNRDKDLIRLRPTCAYSLYGDHPIQCMMTFWLRGNESFVRNKVNTLNDTLKTSFNILRIKIESLAHNSNVNDECENENYFEYHFKVNIESTEEWNKTAKIILPYGGHLFYNPYNKNINPIVTIRRYTSLSDLDNVYQKVAKLLKDNSLKVEDTVEKEYSIYDSNVFLDKNWLFTETPKNFITDIEKIKLF